MKTSKEWTLNKDAWKKLLRNEFVMHCVVWHAPLVFRFLTEIFFEDNGNIYRSVFRRTIGSTIEVPISQLEHYDAPLDFFLEDLTEKRFNAAETRNVHISYWMMAVPHRVCFNPCGSNDSIRLAPEHHLLMVNYGAILETIVLRARESQPDSTWRTLRERFRTFVYQQESKALRATCGETEHMS